MPYPSPNKSTNNYYRPDLGWQIACKCYGGHLNITAYINLTIIITIIFSSQMKG